ncbi:mechanosensitive ion channel family protein [Primorskyibacter flagellatus]|uniref:mechanosensitive ion channel family protein n=1 Tax=Primorskyibacter flagellatus TaxID=1387277 RepID=UPI003A938712
MMSALWSRRTHLFSALAAILLLTCMQAPVIAHAQSAGSGDPPVLAASGEENATTTWSSLVRMIHDRSEQSQALRSRLDSIVHNPISPPDTRSPRATLSSFLVIMAEANELWFATRDRYLARHSLWMSPEEEENVAKVRALFEKAAQTLDLSQISASNREQSVIELVLQLQEILSRIHLPELVEIPGVGAGAAETVENGALRDKWILPGTSLTIERQADGPRRGEYLFTTATVDRIPDDYDTLKTLPVISEMTEDTYRYYIYTPGTLIAPRWNQLILDGPDWLMRQIGRQTVWQWIGMILTVVVLLSAIILYLRWNARRPIPQGRGRRQLRRIAHPVLLILAVNLAVHVCNDQLNITGALLFFITTVGSLIVWIAAAWLTYQVLQLIYIWTVQTTESPTSFDSSLLQTGFRALSFGIALLVLGYGATQIGIPIYGVIAGLGVGGLAIALAAQPTLENFIGGLILYADGIVRVGEYCAFDDLAGTVEEIGIRSTRIRALDQTLITVANADLSKRKIVNYSKRGAFMFRHQIRLRYDTPSDTVKEIIAGVRDYLAAHDRVPESPLRVRLVEYGEFAILIDIYANLAAESMDEFTALQEELLYEIREVVETNGTGFAIPSSTIHVVSGMEA